MRVEKKIILYSLSYARLEEDLREMEVALSRCSNGQ